MEIITARRGEYGGLGVWVLRGHLNTACAFLRKIEVDFSITMVY